MSDVTLRDLLIYEALQESRAIMIEKIVKIIDRHNPQFGLSSLKADEIAEDIYNMYDEEWGDE